MKESVLTTVPTQLNLRVKQLHQEIYVSFRANAYRLLKPGLTRERVKRAMDDKDRENNLFRKADRLVHPTRITYGQIRKIMSERTRAADGELHYSRLLQTHRIEGEPIEVYAARVAALRTAIQSSGTAGYDHIDEGIWTHKLINFITLEENRLILDKCDADTRLRTLTWDKLIVKVSEVQPQFVTKRYNRR